MIVAGAGMGISNVVRPATAVAVADPARAGMTSGINETFQQAGTAIGIAAIGAFFQSRVTAAFHLPAGTAPAGTAKLAGAAAAAGNLHAITARLPAPAGAAATQAARHAFNAGLHDALLATAAIALAGAAAGLLAIRRHDLHTSALTGVPPQTSQAEPPAGALPATVTTPAAPEATAGSSHGR